MTEIQNSKPVYDLEGRIFQIGKNKMQSKEFIWKTLTKLLLCCDKLRRMKK
jgi:hypothetical protein